MRLSQRTLGNRHRSSRLQRLRPTVVEIRELQETGQTGRNPRVSFRVSVQTILVPQPRIARNWEAINIQQQHPRLGAERTHAFIKYAQPWSRTFGKRCDFTKVWHRNGQHRRANPAQRNMQGAHISHYLLNIEVGADDVVGA